MEYMRQSYLTKAHAMEIKVSNSALDEDEYI